MHWFAVSGFSQWLIAELPINRIHHNCALPCSQSLKMALGLGRILDDKTHALQPRQSVMLELSLMTQLSQPLQVGLRLFSQQCVRGAGGQGLDYLNRLRRSDLSEDFQAADLAQAQARGRRSLHLIEQA